MEDIARYIEIKNHERLNLLSLLEYAEELNSTIGLSDSTMQDIKTKASSKLAQIDISIRSHERLLTPNTKAY